MPTITSPTPSDRSNSSDSDLLAQMALALLQASGQLVALFDEYDVLRFANPAFEAAFGMRPDGHSDWMALMRANYVRRSGTIVASADFEHWLASARSRRGKQAFRAFEADLHDGRCIWMTETTLPNGWMLCAASDVTSLNQEERTLRLTRDQALRSAQTDSLTGLGNRVHLMQQMNAAIVRARPFVLVLFDLDHFKCINDSYGHMAGDQVIRDFARHLQACTRRDDSCGRIGGEEFMLLLTEADLAAAQVMVQRLLCLVRAATVMHEQQQITYTCSAGLAAWRVGESAEQLFSRADKAMYRAKHAGHDRVMADELPSA